VCVFIFLEVHGAEVAQCGKESVYVSRERERQFYFK
jgi:hypothetical protein